MSTTASSTTKPTAIESAISEKLSRLYPSSYSIAKVPTSDSGTVTAGITVAEITEKDENHHHDQRDRQQQGELHVATDARMVWFDRRRGDLDGGWNRGLEHWQHRLDPAHGLDDVGTGLALDRHEDRPLLVKPTGNEIVLSAALIARPMSRTGQGRRFDSDHQVGILSG